MQQEEHRRAWPRGRRTALGLVSVALVITGLGARRPSWPYEALHSRQALSRGVWAHPDTNTLCSEHGAPAHAPAGVGVFSKPRACFKSPRPALCRFTFCTFYVGHVGLFIYF